MASWSEKSLKNLATLHVDLQTLCKTVIRVHDCTVLHGHRDEQTQNKLYQEGFSKLQWPDSKHNTDPAEAVDLIPYIPGINPYGDDPRYIAHFAGIVVGLAEYLYHTGAITHKIKWGGNWSIQRDKPLASFYDAAHFELVTD